jgi:hypothetical protein
VGLLFSADFENKLYSHPFIKSATSVYLAFQVIPVDKTQNFDEMYDFLEDNWEIARWVALGVVVFEVGTNSSIFFACILALRLPYTLSSLLIMS